MNKKIFALAILLLSSLVLNVYAALVGVYTVRNQGTLSVDLELAVYFDRECTMPCSEFSWGHVEIAVTKYVALYIKNENTVPMTISATWVNWNPANFSDYATFTSTLYSNPELFAGETKEFDMTLLVSSDYAGPDEFTFDVIVQGTEIVP